MAFLVSRDLIEQARIMLRKEAGLGSCNPNDSSIPSLPTVEEVIAGFDPSPESLRCNHCRGKLLRGTQSLICVYCGREQKRDTPPEPISFKSTIGFRWLLDSLGLDGSETVDLSDEGTQGKRERYSVKDEIPLSNYLDLEMKWPDKSERLGLTDDDVLENSEKNLFQLAGMDFNNSVSKEKSDRSSIPSIGQTMSNEKIVEFEAFPLRGNLGLFENQENSGGAMKPSDGESADSWQADFQAASFVSAHGGVHSPHSAEILSSTHASHMAPVYAPSKDVKDGKPVNDLFSHAPFSIKLGEPDSLSNSLSGVSILAGNDGVSVVPGPWGTVSGLSSVTANQNQHDGKALESVESVRSRDVSSDSDFKTAAYAETDQHLASSTIVSTRDGNCDSSDARDAFTALAESGENRHQTSSISAPEEDSLDAWNDFAGPGTVLDSQPVNGVVNSAEEMSVCVGGDVFGQWNDVESLNNAGGSQCEVSDEMLVLTKKVDHRDTVGLSGDFSSLAEQGDRPQDAGIASTANIMIKKGDNAFNFWGDFTGSTGAQHNAGGNNSLELDHDQINSEGDDVSDHWGDFTGLTNSGSSEQVFKSTEAHGDISISKDDDYAWDVFTSPVRGSEIKLPNEDTAGAWDDVFQPSIQHQVNHQQAPQVEAIHEGDDSSNSWSDFRSSSNAISGQTPGHVAEPVNNTTTEDLSSHAQNGFPSSILQAKQEHTIQKTVSESDTAKQHDDLFDSWGSFSSSSVAQGNQLQNSEARMSQADDIFGGWNSNAGSTTTVDNQLMIDGTSAIDVRKTGKDEETYDAWSDFTSSANLPSNQLKAMVNRVDDKQAATQADPFDSWNFLISSSSSQSNNNDIYSSEHVSTNMLNSSGMNSSLHPALFPDAASGQSGSGNLGILSAEARDSLRAKGDGVKSDHPVSQKDETGSAQTSGEKPIDAETLISQMHDLSFMLENTLSIPKKVD